jgi:hypothetical protein
VEAVDEVSRGRAARERRLFTGEMSGHLLYNTVLLITHSASSTQWSWEGHRVIIGTAVRHASAGDDACLDEGVLLACEGGGARASTA